MVAAAIERELRSRGRSTGWLAQRAAMDRAELVAKLDGRDELTLVDVAQVADVLEVPVSRLFRTEDP